MITNQAKLVEPEKTGSWRRFLKFQLRFSDLRYRLLLRVAVFVSSWTFEPGSALLKSQTGGAQTGDTVGHLHEYSESNQVTLVYYSVLPALPDSTIDA